MPTGFQSFYPDGSVQTDITDRLTKLVMTGSYNIPTGASVLISCPGMEDTDQWFVACSLGNIAVPGTGAFRLYQVGELSGITYYSVFRW